MVQYIYIRKKGRWGNGSFSIMRNGIYLGSRVTFELSNQGYEVIIVVDLAKRHIKALKKLDTKSVIVTYNLGTGNVYSIIYLVKAFSKISGREIPYKIIDRRPEDICEDSWNLQSNNPKGYN